ncbi:MAG: hypothetical protein ACK508_02545 [Lysobacteraceae bacterium]
MDLFSILATVILLTTIGTLVVAVAAYAAFKMREKRKPKRHDPTVPLHGAREPVFLTRFIPETTKPESAGADVPEGKGEAAP